MKNSLCNMTFSSDSNIHQNEIYYIPNFKSTEQMFYLYLDRMSVVKSDGFVNMEKISEYRLISTYDRKTKVLTGKEDLSKLWVYDQRNGSKSIIDGMEENAYIQQMNELADYVRQVVYSMNPELYKKLGDWVSDNSISSLVVYIDDLNNIEKLFSTMNVKDITRQLVQQSLEFNEGKKLKSVIGIPTDILALANDFDMGSQVHLFQQYLKYYNGTVDELRFFFNFFNAVNISAKKRKIAIKEVNVAETFYCFFDAIKNGATLKFLVNCLARDMIFHNNIESADLNENSRYLRDIFRMLTAMRLPVDPISNIHKWHTITSRNYNIFKVSRADEFASAAAKLNELYSMVVDNYRIACPATESELLEIGNKYNNCLPTYRDLVIDKNAMIFSLYQLDDSGKTVDEIPAVTFEVNRHFDFIQVKTFFDADVNDEDILNVLKTWKRRVLNSERIV